jgi:hypothetical protein
LEVRITVNGLGRLLNDAFVITIRNPIVGGFPRLKGLATSVQVTVVGTLALSLFTVVCVGLSGVLRSASPLLRDESLEAVVYVPTIALAIVPLLTAIGLGVVISGAIEAPPKIAHPVVGLYCLLFAALARFCRDADPSSRTWQLVVALTLGVLTTFATARRLVAARVPGRALVIFFTLVKMALVMRFLTSLSSTAEVRLDLAVIRVILQAIALFCLPVVFVAGLDAAKFSITVANWAAERVSRLQSRIAIGIVPLGVLTAGWAMALARIATETSVSVTSFGWSLTAGLVIFFVCWRVGNAAARAESDETVVRSSQALAVRVSAVVVAVPLVIQALGLLEIVIGTSSYASRNIIQPMSAFLQRDTLPPTVRALLGAVLIILVSKHSGNPLQRCLLFMTGGILVTANLSELVSTPPVKVGVMHLDVIVLFASTAYLVKLLISRRLTRQIALTVAGLVVLTGLAAQNSFSSGPLVAILPLGGLGLLVFGLLWGALTGAGDANESSHAFASSSRLVLFAGYQLLTIAVVLWATLLREPRLTDQLASSTALGVRTVGVGLLVAIVIGHARIIPKSEAFAR